MTSKQTTTSSERTNKPDQSTSSHEKISKVDQNKQRVEKLKKTLDDLFDEYGEETPILQYLREKIYNAIQTEEKLTIGFVGAHGSGKSTLINALIGQKIVPSTEIQEVFPGLIEINYHDSEKYRMEVEFLEKEKVAECNAYLNAEYDEITDTASKDMVEYWENCLNKMWPNGRPENIVEPSDAIPEALRKLWEKEVFIVEPESIEALKTEIEKFISCYQEVPWRFIIQKVIIHGRFPGLRGLSLLRIPVYGSEQPLSCNEGIAMSNVLVFVRDYKRFAATDFFSLLQQKIAEIERKKAIFICVTKFMISGAEDVSKSSLPGWEGIREVVTKSYQNGIERHFSKIKNKVLTEAQLRILQEAKVFALETKSVLNIPEIFNREELQRLHQSLIEIRSNKSEEDIYDWIQLADLELFLEILQNTESSAPWQRSKLMMVGQGRAGKSSTVRSFMGLPFNEKWESTIGADTKEVVTVDRQDVNTRMGKSKDPWKQKDTAEEFPSMVARATIHKSSENHEDLESTSSDDEIEDKDSRSESTTEVRASQKVTSVSESVASPESFASTTQLSSKPVSETESVKRYKYELSSDDVKVKVLNALKDEQEGGKDRVTLSIWDYGGQDVFYALHHIFLTRCGIYCVVFNMAELVGSPEDTLSFLLFWLRSIKLHAEEAPIVLVGTRKDEIALHCKDEIELLSSHKEISNLLKEKLNLDGNHLGRICPYYYSEEKRDYLYFFPIDNKKGLHGDPVIVQLKEMIITTVKEKRYVKRKVPISWIRTSDRFRKNEIPYLKIEEAIEIATKAKVSEGRIREMLKFFHQLGVLCYFDSYDELQDIVILNPQWIIHYITKFIRDFDIHKREIIMDIHKHEMFNMEDKLKFDADIKLLQDKGVLRQRLLEHFWKDINKQEQTFLLNLMEKMSLLSRWNANCDPEYLVPSMLPSGRSPKDDKIFQKNNNPEVVFDFNFQEFFLPDGLFPCLVAKIVSHSHSIREFPTILSKGEALLSFEKRMFTLKNCSKEDIIKVGIKKKADAFSVRKFLVEMLEQLKKEVMSDSLKWNVVFHLDTDSTVSLKKIEDAKSSQEDEVLTEEGDLVLLSTISWLLEDQKADSTNLPLHQPVSPKKTYHCFISHDWGKNNVNHEKASKLNSALKQRGLKTWFDQDKIEDVIINEIAKGIEQSDVFVVCITHTYIEKVRSHDENDHCQMEFTYACSKKKPMVAVLMEAEVRDPSKWEGSVGIKLGKSLYHDWSSEDSSVIEKIFQAVLKKSYSINL